MAPVIGFGSELSLALRGLQSIGPCCSSPSAALRTRLGQDWKLFRIGSLLLDVAEAARIACYFSYLYEWTQS